MKRYILVAIALVGFISSAMADTTKLLEADGWTKITTLPTATDIANNYYVFVDNTNDLMLGIGKGVNQNTKWYSLGVFYRTSVEPTSADFIPLTWTLEARGNDFAMRNLDQPVSPFQTEWNAAWKFDTNDVYDTANDWCKVILAYSGGSWTIQNGYYPDSGYLGPWNDGNFTNGAECAANKTGNNVGKFQIYAISRDQFKQNLLDNASDTNPVDITPWYVTNATFDKNNRTGWTEDGSGGNNNTSLGCEIWHRSNFKIYQTLTLPNGKYKVSVQATGSTSGTVYGTSGGTTLTASATVGNKDNFQNSVIAMIQDRNYGRITTDEITVSDGSLVVGFKDETTNQWDVFDNFKVYCTGLDLSAYVEQLAGVVSECNSFIASGVVPEACEAAISSAVATYNKSYDTAKEYSAAIVALSAVLNTYRNNSDLQSAYAAYYAFKAKGEGLMAGVDDGETKTTFTNAISTVTAAVEAATTVDAINTQKALLRSAALTFISGTDGQFDITFLASQNYADWKKKDGSAAGEVTWAVTNRGDWAFAESYEETCATTGTVLYQTVNDLPAGYYQVGMYAMAAYTSGRGFASEATEGDANRSFAFAGNLSDASSILRTGIAIPFKETFDFSELTTLDVNVHLASTGDLTFGVQKDANGSNWHFAQIASIIYSNQPDLTLLKSTRDALVSEANGILEGSADYLTSAQQDALQSAIGAGNAADDFDALNTVTLTTLPNAINTAKQQVQLVKDNRVLMLAALERFENDYNLADGTDYRRLTMSAEAWATLIAKVNAVTSALDDVSQATSYGTLKDELIAQLDATDASLRLFKSYKAMSDGTRSFSIAGSVVGGSATNSETDTDATEQEAIAALNTAFDSYAAEQTANFDVSAFLGTNLDFSAAEGNALNTENSNAIYDVAGWEVAYADADTWTVLQTHQADNDGKLYIRKNWGSAATTLQAQKQKMLPVGKYRLSLSWNSSLTNMANRSAYVLDGTSTTIGKVTTTAESLTYDFEVTGEPKPFDIIVGFQKTGTGNTPAQLVVDDITLTYTPTLLALYDAGSEADGNADAIAAADRQRAVVTLSGRTLYKDGSWNTLCLPFDLDELDDSPLEDAILMELANSLSSGTGFDAETGTLTLNFVSADMIEAGHAYIIKWDKDEDYVDNDTYNIVNPVFTGVTVSNEDPADQCVISEDGIVTFQGLYAPLSVAGGTKNLLYLEAGNQLCWPEADMSIGAFRAYFSLADQSAASVKRIVLNLGNDGEATSIEGLSPVFSERDGVWYTIDGRKLSGKPAAKGIYIQNGQKMLVP